MDDTARLQQVIDDLRALGITIAEAVQPFTEKRYEGKPERLVLHYLQTVYESLEFIVEKAQAPNTGSIQGDLNG